MASGKKSRNSRPAPVVSRRQGLPWLTIGAVVAVVALIGAIFVVVYSRNSENSAAADRLAPWVPSEENKDPSVNIPGIYVGASVEENGVITFPKYKAALHVESTERVAYDRYPAVGGPHDGVWAACNGVIYTQAVREENMVHPLEHGAIWIAYNPDTIADGDLAILEGLVRNQTFMVLSPYPTLDQPISLQSWGHQLKLQSASDERIQEFITALKQNQYVYPEIGATCDQPSFDTENPPPFVPGAPGADAIPLDGSGLTSDTSEVMTDDTASGSETASGTGSATSSEVSGSGTSSESAETSGSTESAVSTSGSVLGTSASQ
ncbi:DUF3105 domain-containing protein [Nakamurella sp. YIM 132087]|uniref:DUF3105 domain-containing protein n=2 Tax=Nakamurella alba TaxID=2665158 RepID=A0A7K1FHN4_9ACTN|nr:DUF3105 domain-containing protein [Nakamurella alba]